MGTNLNSESSLPKYLKISQDVIGSIQNEGLEAGDLVMSENEIIEKYKVSNTTARKALREVEDAGWVKRIKGKGTIVQNKRVGRSVDRILGFTKNMIESGREPSTRLLDVYERKREVYLTIKGQQYMLPSPIFVIERLRLADGIPIMEETRYISGQLCPDIDTKDLESSLYDIYEDEYELYLTEVQQVLSTIVINNKRLKQLFELQKTTPAFLVEGISLIGRGVILEMEESIYRGDQYQFNVTATR